MECATGLCHWTVPLDCAIGLQRATVPSQQGYLRANLSVWDEVTLVSTLDCDPAKMQMMKHRARNKPVRHHGEVVTQSTAEQHELP
jgi:hypothetical protein